MTNAQSPVSVSLSVRQSVTMINARDARAFENILMEGGDSERLDITLKLELRLKLKLETNRREATQRGLT